jgi:hypothetical protein
MRHPDNMDNVYKAGTVITARENPGLKLMVTKYYHRIYYCSIVNDPTRKQLVYFERELIPPVAGGE